MIEELAQHLTGATIRGVSIQRPSEQPNDPTSSYLELEVRLADGRDATLWIAVESAGEGGWRDVDPGLVLAVDLVQNSEQDGIERIAEVAEPLYP